VAAADVNICKIAVGFQAIELFEMAYALSSQSRATLQKRTCISSTTLFLR
jgi:hypothetical protein